jgi:hypothetical protein
VRLGLTLWQPNRRRLLALLELLAVHNADYLRKHPETPALYESGVYFKPEQRGRDVLDAGWGDCEDLAAWRLAEYRVRGIAARADLRPGGTPEQLRAAGRTRLLHAVVVLADGRVDDPSLRLRRRKASIVKPALIVLALVLALSGAASAAPPRRAAPPPSRARAALPPRGADSGGTLPGVPADLQEPIAPPRAPAPAARPRPAAQNALHPDAPLAVGPLQAAPVAPVQTRTPAPSSRGTRLSVQPAALPSTPLAAGMTVAQRARARDLARAAAVAVRGEQPARRAGVQPQPLAPVTAFQAAVGLHADGRWGRQTRAAAAAFTGNPDQPAVVW